MNLPHCGSAGWHERRAQKYEARYASLDRALNEVDHHRRRISVDRGRNEIGGRYVFERSIPAARLGPVERAYAIGRSDSPRRDSARKTLVAKLRDEPPTGLS